VVLSVKVELSALWNGPWEYRIFSRWTSSFSWILNKKVRVRLADDDARRAQDTNHITLQRNWLWYSLQSVADG
jgi:hypothetical protein